LFAATDRTSDQSLIDWHWSIRFARATGEPVAARTADMKNRLSYRAAEGRQADAQTKQFAALTGRAAGMRPNRVEK
jgi:hypothetical protein